MISVGAGKREESMINGSLALIALSQRQVQLQLATSFPLIVMHIHYLFPNIDVLHLFTCLI